MREVSTDNYVAENFERLNRYIETYEVELKKAAHRLAYQWFDVFDSLAEDVEHAADILFNEAYIAAAASIHSLDPITGNFRSWFTRIMLRNLQRKTHRLIKKRDNNFVETPLSQCLDEHPPNVDTSAKDPLDLLIPLLWNEQEEQIVNCIEVEQLLASLSPQDREIIELRYYQRYSIPEIAQMLHWSTTNAAALKIHRILLRLRSTLGETSEKLRR
jgi:RNA polymerase sigma factor (sigma-70 family)